MGTIKLSVIQIILFSLVTPWLGPADSTRAHAFSQKKGRAQTRTAASEKFERTSLEISRLAEHAINLRNLELKVRTLIGLADLSWNHDETFGRQLFLKAFEVLRLTKPVEKATRPATGDSTAEVGEITKNRLISLYILFFAHLAKHDPNLEQTLLGESQREFLDVPNINRSLDLSAASMFLQENDPRAFDYLSKGAANGINGHLQTMQVLDLLMRSRAQDEQRADQLFLEVLKQLTSQAKTSADDYLTIGNYLFTSPQSVNFPNKVVVSPVYVGKVGFHADISVDRPSIQPLLIQAYLKAAIAIFSRRGVDDSAQLQNRAAAFLLIPKARRFAPNLLPELVSLASGLEGVRTNSTDAGTTGTQRLDSKPDLESVTATLEKIKDDEKRNEYVLRMIGFFYSNADFKLARTLADKITLLSVREKLSDLISFRESVVALQTGSVSQAISQARRLTPTPQRSFLWFAIAKVLIEKRDLRGARSAIDAGLDDARRADGSAKASLLLLAVEQVGKIDSDAAQGTFIEVLETLAAIDSDVREPLGFDRSVAIKIGSQVSIFNTNINGINPGTLSGAMKHTLGRDHEGITSSLLGLSNEHLRSSAILALASAALE